MYENILFDLDGTLTDPGLGITNSVTYALEKFGIRVEERATLYKFIGPPLKDAFMGYYGFSEDEAERAITYYREYFADKGIFENKPYDGVGQMLCELKKSGRKLLLATSKPQKFAEIILKHFGLDLYFDSVVGASMDGSLSRKGDIISLALEKERIRELGSTIMIGDRMHDIIGAKENGIDSVGVLYGYGDREELEAAGAVYFAEKPCDIPDILR